MVDKDTKKEAMIVVFDSLGKTQDLAVKNIENYLLEELKNKKNIVKKNAAKLVVYPSCPHQDDLTSCGVYLLHYSDQILSRYCI